ncbi:hypothetical protein [Engelhardtia mirabilis]|uniref:hypothetical protein n=1 Tax=Engelhardtia mirabilis TaxID=2528011 RepID=UPI00119CF988
MNLLLAGAFLGWASQVLKAGQDYKTSYLEEEKAHTETRNDLESQISKLNAELAAQRDTLGQVREAASKDATELAAKKNELVDAEKDNDELRSSLGGYNERLDLLANKVEASDARAADAAREARDAVVAKEDAEDAQRDAEIARRDAEDRAAKLASDLAAVTVRAETLTNSLAAAERNLENMSALSGIDLGTLVQQPAVDRSVVDVRMDLSPGFVAINAGSALGIRRGMVFDVYRGQVYKGKVRVETVDEDMCTAVVTTAVDGAAIQVGDNATTAL